jgi:ActR/RegA family two-component response regulator
MARLSHVLVIDSDPQGLQAMSFGFEREGIRVTTAVSTDDALLCIQANRPDAVVVTLRQGADPSRFILEELSAGSMLPVVAVGTEDHRRAVVGQANVDFLTVPAYLRDVITATRMRAASRKDGKDPVVQGALSEYGLFFLLRTILASKQSTIIQIERANRKGELKICKGELRTAQIGTITGAPALNQMLLWEEAALEVRFKAVTARSQFNNKASVLMEEVERFLRDFAHSARALGSAQTVYEVSATNPVEVASEVAPVLRLFDGQRSISDVLDESPFRVFDTLRIISRFSETETIKKKLGVEARPAVSTSAASPLMETWLRGESERERIDAVAAAAISSITPIPVSIPAGATSQAQAPSAAHSLSPQSGGTGPLPILEQSRVPAVAATVPAAPVKGQAAKVVAPLADESNLTPATGTIARSTRGEMVAKASTGEKAYKQRPSMVIDLPADFMESQTSEPTPAPVVVQPALAAAPAARSVAPLETVPAQNTLPGGAVGHEPIVLGVPKIQAIGGELGRAGGINSDRTTGSMEIRTAPRQTKTHTPIASGSIELDPSLMAEMEPPRAAPRIAAPAPIASVAPVEPVARQTGPVSNPFKAKTRTGEFDDLEKDFFDREKDLYKPEKSDSFDDM